ncbi:formate/nitrite transporter family protein [Halobellus rubicundus]|uniref:Formate/nitrite transporter family protein n=1 Tax=Halobellus rubicundus TaxID=2996466 RepID=A0ABD5MDY1_9EURY
MRDSDPNPDDADARSSNGVPSSGEVVPDRFSSDEVFQRIVADADHEITSGTRELFFSGLAAGFAITITFLLYASMSTGTDSRVIASLLYPLGFVYIIIGGYQLYTENTLPPVALTLERLASIPALLRHWLIVLAGNFLGGGAGAVVLAYGGVFDPATMRTATDIAEKGVVTPASALFFKAVFAGLIVAGVVWMNFAARDTISRIAIVYLAFLAIPLGNLFHVVVSFTEVVFLVLVGDLGLVSGLGGFVLPVLLGNTIGGVLLVTVVNYYQTSERRLEVDRFEHMRRLSPREWVLGNLAGRSYVPVVDTLGDIVRDPDSYRILVPIANPRTESRLVEFACKLASDREQGTVHAVHIVQTPDRITSHAQTQRIGRESERLLADLERTAEGYDVAFETSTIVSSRSFEAVFDRARRTRPDLVAMGWGEDRLWKSARAERPIDELTNRLPCDFLVIKDRGLDPSRLLLPIAAGLDSELGGEIARTLQSVADSAVELLHVVDGDDEREAGEAFLDEWAERKDLSDATRTIDTAGDVEDAIERRAADSTMLILGATERGLLSRLVTDSLHFSVSHHVEASVLLAERPSDRTLRERLFGRGSRFRSRDSE